MKPKYQEAIEIIKANGGVIRTTVARDKGIHYRTLYELRDQGEIETVSRGLYQLFDRTPVGEPDLETVALKIPKAIVCLISALSYHNLTTQIPHTVSIALPQRTKTPKLDYPPVTVHRMDDSSINSGVEEYHIGVAAVKVFSAEKTIADCFKFRNKIGMDIVLEALKLYMARKDKNTKKLLEYAKVCRVTKVITPYLESLV